MKLMITGGTGFIGRHLADYWKHSHHTITVVARYIDAALFESDVNCIAADITSKQAIQAAIVSCQPDVVIHTAALSKPNDCELDKDACFTTNITATTYILDACKAIGAKLIFLSTDFVFGSNGPYTETDACEPVNYYGQSKRLAEEAIRATDISYAIVRTGLVVGPKLAGQSNTFLHWVKESLEAGKQIKLYTDQQRSPTFVTDLCSGINTIVENGFNGTVHLSCSQVFSPYTLAQQVAAYFQLTPALLIPITYLQQPEPARRPPNAVLSIDKAKKILGYTTTPFNEILQAVFQ